MVSRYNLANGLTVVTVPQTSTATVTVMLLVPVGSRHEQPNNNGISHFLEHLMFKGTTKRPSTLELTKQLDAVGAAYNAFTGKDTTSYFIKVAADHLELALDLFSDMVFHSLFDPKEIDRERGVIIEELNMYKDNPMMHVETLLEMSIFHKQHPLGYDIGGQKRNIKQLPRATFMAYKKKHYAPAAMHLVLSGKLDARARRWVQQYFGSYEHGQKAASFKHFRSYQRRPQFLHEYKDTQQTQLTIGFPAVSLRRPQDLATLSVLSTILGGNMSSRLFISIRERQGLCYVIHSDVSAYLDTGVFMIQAGLDNKRIAAAVMAIMKELRLLKAELVSAEELKNAKDCIKGQTALKLEDSAALAGYYGQQSVLLHTITSPQDKLRRIARVTREDIRRLAQRVLHLDKINVASIGPQRSLTKLRSHLAL
jgi:predicted Zn-dependent peptidase